MNELQLQRIACRVWADFLGVVAVPARPGEAGEHQGLTSTIRFDGAQDGVLALSLSHDHARDLAASVFVLHPSEVGERDVHDLMCELAHIMAVDVTARLAGRCSLKRAQIAKGVPADDTLAEPGEAGMRSHLHSEGSSVLIRFFATA